MRKPSEAQTAYWEAKLKRYGLTADKGRVVWLDYGHKVTDLDYDGRLAYRPKQELSELEREEWPSSLY